MRILVSIVHYCNPKGDGVHGSLRRNTEPRRRALQDQLLALSRLGFSQGVLNMESMRVDNANQALRHQISIRIVTDGEHHLVDQLDAEYQPLFEHVSTSPKEPKQLGFEAHRLLADSLDENFDLYAYFEDDLIITDPLFFHKINWFQTHAGQDAVLLPNRMELFWKPDKQVQRFYIDGPVPEKDLKFLLRHPATPISTPLPGGNLVFDRPKNPHAGCFVISHQQMKHWSARDWFLDRDCSYVSGLESAATLGICKTFRIFKPHVAFAAFLEIQHWGSGFFSLIGDQIKPQLPQSPDDATSDEDALADST